MASTLRTGAMATAVADSSVAVIDVGKTNAKVALVDAGDGAESGAPHGADDRAPTDGPYPHFDVARIWDFLCDSLAALNREHADRRDRPPPRTARPAHSSPATRGRRRAGAADPRL